MSKYVIKNIVSVENNDIARLIEDLAFHGGGLVVGKLSNGKLGLRTKASFTSSHAKKLILNNYAVTFKERKKSRRITEISSFEVAGDRTDRWLNQDLGHPYINWIRVHFQESLGHIYLYDHGESHKFRIYDASCIRENATDGDRISWIGNGVYLLKDWEKISPRLQQPKITIPSLPVAAWF